MFLEGLQQEADPDGEKPEGPETDGMEDDDAFGQALHGAKMRRQERET
jgi:hypothetical protein